MSETWESHAARHPDKPAISGEGGGLTYGELRRAVDRAVRRYRTDAGWTVLGASNTVDFVVDYLAAHKAQAPVVLGDGSESARSALGTLGRGVPSEVASIAAPEVVFTSGTTARQRGIVLDGHEMFRKAQSINAFMRNDPDDVEVLMMPLSHSIGLGRLRCALSNGQSVLLQTPSSNPAAVFGLVERCPRAGLGLVASAMKILMSRAPESLARCAERISYVEIGGEAFEPGYRKALSDLLPGSRLAASYGMTELSRATMVDLADPAAPESSVGRPMAGVEAELRAVPSDQGTVRHEILLRGAAMARAFLGADTLVPLEHGAWIPTGDLGSADDGGYLTIEGRLANMAKIMGRNVAFEVTEREIHRLVPASPCVCTSAELLPGVSILVAVIEATAEAPVDPEALRAELIGRLPEYQVPRRVMVVPGIARLANGKLDRRAAQALAAGAG